MNRRAWLSAILKKVLCMCLKTMMKKQNVLLPMKVMEYLKSRISQSIRKIRERAMAKH